MSLEWLNYHKLGFCAVFRHFAPPACICYMAYFPSDPQFGTVCAAIAVPIVCLQVLAHICCLALASMSCYSGFAVPNLGWFWPSIRLFRTRECPPGSLTLVIRLPWPGMGWYSGVYTYLGLFWRVTCTFQHQSLHFDIHWGILAGRTPEMHHGGFSEQCNDWVRY